MKRFRLGEDMADSVDMAGVLMLLSRGRSGESTNSSSSSRVFECKTCNRQFPSFQALGGHRASHKKLRPVPPEADGGKQKVHGCSICGVEFAVGQALGGHMRRHRLAEGGAGSVGIVGGEKRRRRVWLDLNLPPSMSTEDEMECRKTGFGLENIVDPIPMVDCLY